MISKKVNKRKFPISIKVYRNEPEPKQNSKKSPKVGKNRKIARVIACLMIVGLGIFQVKSAFNQIKTDFGNMTEGQKDIARSVLGQEEYDKLANNSTSKVALDTRESIQALSRGDINRTSESVSGSSISQKPTSPSTIAVVKSQPKPKLSEKEIVMLAVEKTCEMVGLDVRDGKTLVHTESRFDPNSIGDNGSSTDYGLCQINNQGGVIADFLGKRVDLADGRKKVLVTSQNYKTDMYINLAIGLADFKRYLEDLSGNNPYIAYACYNAGEGTASIFKGYNKSSLSMNEVVSILQNTGRNAFKHASRNIKNNFAISYAMYH